MENEDLTRIGESIGSELGKGLEQYSAAKKTTEQKISAAQAMSGKGIGEIFSGNYIKDSYNTERLAKLKAALTKAEKARAEIDLIKRSGRPATTAVDVSTIKWARDASGKTMVEGYVPKTKKEKNAYLMNIEGGGYIVYVPGR